MSMTYISNDVWFDENFIGTRVDNKNRTRVPRGVHLQPHPEENLDDNDDQLEVVGHLLPFDQGGESGTPSQISHPKTSVYFDVEEATPSPGVSFESTEPEVQVYHPKDSLSRTLRRSTRLKTKKTMYVGPRMSKAQTAMQIHLEKFRNLVNEDIIPKAYLQSLEDIKEESELHEYRLE